MVEVQKNLMEGKKVYTSILTSTRKVLSLPRVLTALMAPSITTTLTGGPPKTVDRLKPKEPLNKEMKLEEAN